MDSKTYEDPLNSKSDTRTYNRIYYTDDLLGTRSIYYEDSVIYYEIFDVNNTQRAIFFINGLQEGTKYQCNDNFTVIHSL